MAKRRGESTATFKLRKKQAKKRQQTQRLPSVKREMASHLIKKCDEIGMLAIKHERNYLGAQNFREFLATRMRWNRQLKSEYSSFKERREMLIRLLFGERILRNQVLEVNEWLEKIGRPELKLSVNETIEMILA